MLRMLVFSSLTGRAFLKDLLPLRLSGFWRLRGWESRGTCSWREGWTSWAGRLVAMVVVVVVVLLVSVAVGVAVGDLGCTVRGCVFP